MIELLVPPGEEILLTRSKLPDYLTRLNRIWTQAWLDLRDDTGPESSAYFKALYERFVREWKRYFSHVENKVINSGDLLAFYRFFNIGCILNLLWDPLSCLMVMFKKGCRPGGSSDRSFLEVIS